jgi:hypothetical protein
MKRILTCLLVLLVVGVFDPESSWADPRRQEYDVPGEQVGGGDDDEPTKTGLPVSTPSPVPHGSGVPTVTGNPDDGGTPPSCHMTIRHWIGTLLEQILKFTKTNSKSLR